MTDEEISNGNELIAKFMGYQILNKKYETQYMCSSNESAWGVTEGEIVCDSQGREVDDENQEPYFYLEHLPFNSSWDWLMPVIVKIQHLGYVCVMHGNYCNILDIESFKGHYSKKEFDCDCYSSSPETLISAVHWCVIKFIKWDNLKK